MSIPRFTECQKFCESDLPEAFSSPADMASPSASNPRILLAEAHLEVSKTVTKFLEPAYQIVGRVGDGQTLVNAAAELKPDVVITEICMPILSGIEAARRLRESGSTAKIVFLTVHGDADYVRACLATGAFGYVVKSRIATDLLHAVRETLVGRTFVSPSADAQNYPAFA
jgi:DNA-binding NarL/FixJ family response regulator